MVMFVLGHCSGVSCQAESWGVHEEASYWGQPLATGQDSTAQGCKYRGYAVWFFIKGCFTKISDVSFCVISVVIWHIF